MGEKDAYQQQELCFSGPRTRGTRTPWIFRCLCRARGSRRPPHRTCQRGRQGSRQISLPVFIPRRGEGRREGGREGGREGRKGRREVEEVRVCGSLREDGEEVALGEVEGDASDVDVGGVLELGVPRSVLADAQERLLLVDNLRPLHLREGIHRRRSGRRRRLLERRWIWETKRSRVGVWGRTGFWISLDLIKEGSGQENRAPRPAAHPGGLKIQVWTAGPALEIFWIGSSLLPQALFSFQKISRFSVTSNLAAHA